MTNTQTPTTPTAPARPPLHRRRPVQIAAACTAAALTLGISLAALSGAAAPASQPGAPASQRTAAQVLNADDYPLYAQLQPGDLYASGYIRDAATGTRGSWSELIVIARSPADAQLLAQEMQPTVRQLNGAMTTSGAVMRLAMTYLPNDSNPGSGPLLIRVIGDDNAMTAFMSLWSPDPAGLVPPPTG